MKTKIPAIYLSYTKSALRVVAFGGLAVGYLVAEVTATLLLLAQPLVSIMILKNIEIRNLLIYSYLLLAIPFSIYKFSTNDIYSSISKNGHLRWNFFDISPVIWIVWLFFFLFSFSYEKQWFGVIFGLVTLFITVINYKNDNTVGSMWCWSVNALMIYFAIYLLIYLPFLEKMNIC